MNPAQVTISHPRNLGTLLRDSGVFEKPGLESGMGLILGLFYGSKIARGGATAL